MANYLEMNREELAAEKAKLNEQYKKFQAMGLKLNMARGKPGPHQMDLAMDLLKMTRLHHRRMALMPATMATWKVCTRPASCLRMCGC